MCFRDLTSGPPGTLWVCRIYQEREREGHILPPCSLEDTHSLASPSEPGFQRSTQCKAHGARQVFLVAKGTEGSQSQQPPTEMWEFQH